MVRDVGWLLLYAAIAFIVCFPVWMFSLGLTLLGGCLTSVVL